MPNVTGNVADTGFSQLAEARIIFRIPAPAFDTEGRVHVTQDVEVTPDSSGAFTAALPDYVTHPTPMPVYVGIAWWSHPSDVQAGRAPRIDWLQQPIYIAPGSNSLAALIDKQIGNDRVFVTVLEPDTSQVVGFQLVDGRYLYVREDLA